MEGAVGARRLGHNTLFLVFAERLRMVVIWSTHLHGLRGD
jgi:hypothetical protein